MGKIYQGRAGERQPQRCDFLLLCWCWDHVTRSTSPWACLVPSFSEGPPFPSALPRACGCLSLCPLLPPSASLCHPCCHIVLSSPLRLLGAETHHPWPGTVTALNGHLLGAQSRCLWPMHHWYLDGSETCSVLPSGRAGPSSPKVSPSVTPLCLSA